MLDAINQLSGFQFVVFVLAVLTGVTQLFLLLALALHGRGITLVWGWISAALWILLFFITR